jgi:hypothetical protein
MPATLSEGFFITNSYEANLLKNNSNSRLDKEAQAIAQGIENYFSNPNGVKTYISNNSLVINRIDSE